MRRGGESVASSSPCLRVSQALRRYSFVAPSFSLPRYYLLAPRSSEASQTQVLTRMLAIPVWVAGTQFRGRFTILLDDHSIDESRFELAVLEEVLPPQCRTTMARSFFAALPMVLIT